MMFVSIGIYPIVIQSVLVRGFKNAAHFLWHVQTTLQDKVEVFCGFTLKVLLCGRADLSVHANNLLFEAVRKYILESHRFD